ncbi:MAG: hypothetical protein CMC74_01655 [Flavobacteriaceae bacterium]|nr:hypothetical protein [Flavobacteriaceae bacterium]
MKKNNCFIVRWFDCLIDDYFSVILIGRRRGKSVTINFHFHLLRIKKARSLELRATFTAIINTNHQRKKIRSKDLKYFTNIDETFCFMLHTQ